MKTVPEVLEEHDVHRMALVRALDATPCRNWDQLIEQVATERADLVRQRDDAEAEVERLTKDRDHWHDTYQADAGARDQLLAELLNALPGDHSEMLDAHAEVLNGVERLVKELTEIHGDIRFCLKVIFDGDWTRTESVLAARRSRLVGLSIPHGGVYDPKTPDGGETP